MTTAKLKALKKAGVNLSDLARLCDLHPDQVGGWARKQTRIPEQHSMALDRAALEMCRTILDIVLEEES